MGQCTSCEAQRTVPNSPQVEFPPSSDLFSSAAAQTSSQEFINTEPESRATNLDGEPSSLSTPILISAHCLSKESLSLELSVQLLNKGIRKLEAKPRKYYRISPRTKSKLKVVTFSDPEVSDSEPIKKSVISASLNRIKLRTTRSKYPAPTPTITSARLIPSPILDLNEANGKVTSGNSSINSQETEMGNNSSSQTARHKALTPERRAHVPKSSTFGCNSRSAISKQQDSNLPTSVSTSHILKSVNHNKVNPLRQCVNNNDSYKDALNSNCVPVSPQTLQELSASREEKNQLRSRFFSGVPASVTVPQPICTPSPSKIPVPIKMMNSDSTGSGGFQKNPIKTKRTFEYQPPSEQRLATSSSASQVPKLYSTGNINGNLNESQAAVLKSSSLGTGGAFPVQQRLRFNSTSSFGKESQEWRPATDVFTSSQTSLESDFDPRRSSAPPRVLTQRKHSFGLSPKIPVPVRGPTDFPAVVGDNSVRHSLIGWKSKIVSVNGSGLQKPIPTQPFFMMGFYGPRSAGFQGVSTGVVNQRKQFYQTRIIEENRTVPAPPPRPFPVLRSATWVKDPPEVATVIPNHVPKSHSTHFMGESTGTIKDFPVLTSTLNEFQDKDTIPETESQSQRDITLDPGSVSEEGPKIQLQVQDYPKADTDSITSKTSSNFPVRHEGSGTSTTSLSRSGRSVSREREHNAISDSEFLIDDEISDQPELTLTFKDSSLILPLSSSEESLLSCDLMLDHTSREISNDHHQDRNMTTSDSAISDVSCGSRNPAPPSRKSTTKTASNASGGRSGGSRVIPVSSTPTSSRLTKPSFGYRNAQQQKPSPAPTSRLTPDGPPRSTNSPASITPQKNPRVSEKKTPKSASSSSIPDSRSRSSLARSPASPSPTALKPLSKLTVTNRANLHRPGSRHDSSSSSTSLAPDGNSHGDAGLTSSFIEELAGSVRDLSLELEALRGALEEQERIGLEKDQAIERLTKENERLRRKPKELIDAGDEGLEKVSTSDHEKEIKTSSHPKRDNMINTAAQTDSPSKNKISSYPDEDNDKLGQLVSFRIGRRSTPK